MHAERFFNARRAAPREQRLGIAVRGVSADEDNPGAEFGAILLDPRMNFRAVYRTRHSNVGDYAEILSVVESRESLSAGSGIDYGISASLECRPQKRRYRRLVLNQKNGRGRVA